MASKTCPLCEKTPQGVFGFSGVKLSTGEHLCADCGALLKRARPYDLSFKKYSVEDVKGIIERFKEAEATNEKGYSEAPAPKRARCPSCRSDNIMPVGRKHKSYSFKKAAAGAVLFTPAVGALVGFTGGTGKHEFYCQDCGKIFKR